MLVTYKTTKHERDISPAIAKALIKSGIVTAKRKTRAKKEADNVEILEEKGTISTD